MEKISRKLETAAAGIMYTVLAVFAVLTFVLTRSYWAAATEIVAIFVLYLVMRRIREQHRKCVHSMIQQATYGSELAQKNAMVNFPLPIAAYMTDTGRVIWGNRQFFSICGVDSGLDRNMTELVPNYNGAWLTEGRRRATEVTEIEGRRYQVHGSVIRDNRADGVVSLGITYWVDVTDYDQLKHEYSQSRPVVMLILIDNYDELMKGATDRAKSDLRSGIEDKLNQWTNGCRGLLRRYDRDRYIYICEYRYYDKLAQDRFSVIDSVHDVVNNSGIRATVSVGCGLDGVSYEEDFSFASLSVDMALSRGGDQAVTKNRMNFEFFGGRDAEVETRTRVRSRVVATALASFIKESPVTYIMGHSYPDMDALGAAVGLCCIARSLGKKARIVLSDRPNACGALVEILKRQPEYEDIFISPKEAMVQAVAGSLLVVVDTNRPEGVEDQALLQSISRLVVVDHHRRGSSYIENATLTLYEPYASSVCELVVELLQELVDQKHILPYEANAMLAGIVTDTKNFTMRTGERTFDAAAYLRRAGADPVAVKRFLQNDFETTVTRYTILEHAQMFRDTVCVAVMDQEVGRVVAAQAADEMLNISGVEASVVMYPASTGEVILSARSIGSMNVQVLMEKLGGGGNQSAAAAQLKNTTIEEAVGRLYAAVDEYLNE